MIIKIAAVIQRSDGGMGDECVRKLRQDSRMIAKGNPINGATANPGTLRVATAGDERGHRL